MRHFQLLCVLCLTGLGASTLSAAPPVAGSADGQKVVDKHHGKHAGKKVAEGKHRKHHRHHHGKHKKGQPPVTPNVNG